VRLPSRHLARPVFPSSLPDGTTALSAGATDGCVPHVASVGVSDRPKVCPGESDERDAEKVAARFMLPPLRPGVGRGA
jgi:hypothetical protein